MSENIRGQRHHVPSTKHLHAALLFSGSRPLGVSILAAFRVDTVAPMAGTFSGEGTLPEFTLPMDTEKQGQASSVCPTGVRRVMVCRTHCLHHNEPSWMAASRSHARWSSLPRPL